jgi:hypothetical protein
MAGHAMPRHAVQSPVRGGFVNPHITMKAWRLQDFTHGSGRPSDQNREENR